jgi:hypothetical protein
LLIVDLREERTRRRQNARRPNNLDLARTCLPWIGATDMSAFCHVVVNVPDIPSERLRIDCLDVKQRFIRMNQTIAMLTVVQHGSH